MNINSKVIIFPLIIILFLEILIRYTAPFLSGNIKHIQSIPLISDKFNMNQERVPILLLGNSLIYNGVDLPTLHSEFNNNAKINLDAYKIVPDDTGIWDWYFLYRKNFYKHKVAPKILVVGFAWNLLSDQSKIKPDRIGGYYSDITDLPHLVSMGIDETKYITEFIIGNISQLYVNRETVHKRILAKLVPYYRNVTQQLNELSPNTRMMRTGHKTKYNYIVLKQWLRMLKEQNVRVLFMSMPVVKPYQIDENLKLLLKKYDALLLDYRELTGINQTMFLDSIHLNKEGRVVLTKKLSQEMNKLFF